MLQDVAKAAANRRPVLKRIVFFLLWDLIKGAQYGTECFGSSSQRIMGAGSGRGAEREFGAEGGSHLCVERAMSCQVEL